VIKTPSKEVDLIYYCPHLYAQWDHYEMSQPSSQSGLKQEPGDVTQQEQEYFMKQALLMVLKLLFSVWASLADLCSQGERALAGGETPVGCVLVLQGKVIGSGMNDTNRSMNVRSNAIRAVYRNIIL
jgi:hypothetical protein